MRVTSGSRGAAADHQVARPLLCRHFAETASQRAAPVPARQPDELPRRGEQERQGTTPSGHAEPQRKRHAAPTRLTCRSERAQCSNAQSRAWRRDVQPTRPCTTRARLRLAPRYPLTLSGFLTTRHSAAARSAVGCNGLLAIVILLRLPLKFGAGALFAPPYSHAGGSAATTAASCLGACIGKRTCLGCLVRRRSKVAKPVDDRDGRLCKGRAVDVACLDTDELCTSDWYPDRSEFCEGRREGLLRCLGVLATRGQRQTSRDGCDRQELSRATHR